MFNFTETLLGFGFAFFAAAAARPVPSALYATCVQGEVREGVPRLLLLRFNKFVVSPTVLVRMVAAVRAALLGDSTSVVIFTSGLVIPAIVGSLPAPPFDDSTPSGMPVETWLFE